MTSPIEYIPDFWKGFWPWENSTIDDMYRSLPFEQRPDAPRQEFWMNDYGTEYSYGRGPGRRTYKSNDWEELPLILRDLLSVKFGVLYQGMFANYYVDGTQHLGWHSDDDPSIDHNKPIAVISFGAAREIWFRPIGATGDEREVLLLEHGSLLLMLPGMQFTHQHRIPKSDRPVGARISFTYRGLIPKD